MGSSVGELLGLWAISFILTPFTLFVSQKTIILVYSCTFFRDVNIEVSLLGFSKKKKKFFFWSQSSAGQKISHCDKLSELDSYCKEK